MKFIEDLVQKIKDAIEKKKSEGVKSEEVKSEEVIEENEKVDIKDKVLANLGIKPLNTKKLAIVGGGLSAILVVGIILSTSGTDETSNAKFLNKVNNSKLPSTHSNFINNKDKKVSLNTKNMNNKKTNTNTYTHSQGLKKDVGTNNPFQKSANNTKTSKFSLKKNQFQSNKKIKEINIANPMNACRPNLSNIDKLFLSFATERKKLLQEEMKKKTKEPVAIRNGRETRYKRMSEDEVLKLLMKEEKKKEKKKEKTETPAPVRFINLEISGIFCPTVKDCYAITNIGVVKKGMVLPYGEKVVQVSAERGIVTDKRVIPY